MFGFKYEDLIMDRVVCQNFRKDFAEAVKELEKKYGAKITLGNISFDDHSFTSKLSVVETVNVPKFVPSQIANEFLEFTSMYSQYKGVKKLQELPSAKINGDSWTLIGYRSKARKSPFIIMNSKGGLGTISFDLMQKYYNAEVNYKVC